MTHPITLYTAQAILNTRFGGVIRCGQHSSLDGACCVRELAFALRFGKIPDDPDAPIEYYSDWTDHPDGPNNPTDAACIKLNDADWPDDETRTRVCLPLALLVDSEAAPGWVTTYAEATIREIVPLAYEAAASVHPDRAHQQTMRAAARRCHREGSPDAARAAARAAEAARAADLAARAAFAAFAAEKRTQILTLAVDLLIRCHNGTWTPRPLEIAP